MQSFVGLCSWWTRMRPSVASQSAHGVTLHQCDYEPTCWCYSLHVDLARVRRHIADGRCLTVAPAVAECVVASGNYGNANNYGLTSDFAA